jgi:TatA/E family protein of Tat protein translocase
MFGSLGGPELLLILVVALIVFGPRKLPEIGKSMGKMLVEFRRASNDFKRTIETEVESEKNRPGAGGTSTPVAPHALTPAATSDEAPGAPAGAEAAPEGSVAREPAAGAAGPPSESSR